MTASRTLLRCLVLSCTLGILLLAATPVIAAEALETSGKVIAAKWGDAIVSVKIAIKVRIAVEGKEVENRDFEYEDIGTVVDPGGVTALSLSDIDPSDYINQLAGGKRNFSATSEVTALKILDKAGNEIPAKIVLRDKDLDLALIAPQTPLSSPAVSLDLAAASKPGLLENVVILSRFGRIANREISVSTNEVQAVVKKPRPFYILSQATIGLRTGSAVFTADGKTAGILLLRRIKPQGEGSPIGSDLNVMVIVIPAEDISDLLRQTAKK